MRKDSEDAPSPASAILLTFPAPPLKTLAPGSLPSYSWPDSREAQPLRVYPGARRFLPQHFLLLLDTPS